MQVSRRAPYLSTADLVIRIADMIGLFAAMYLSEILVENTVFGGAIYILGEVWVIYARLYNKRNIHLLSASTRANGLFIFLLAALLTFALVFFFPYIQAKPTSLLLILLIGVFIVQQIASDTINQRIQLHGKRRTLLLAGVHLLFIVSYAIIFFSNQFIFGYETPVGIGSAYLAVIICSICAFFYQLYQKPVLEKTVPIMPTEDNAKIGADQIMNVHSYRIYNKMAVNTFVAINLSITSFICYMRFLPYTGFLASILSLCLWLGFIGLVTAGGFFLLNKRYLAKYDRPAIFLAGLMFWAISTFAVLQGWWGDSLVSSLLKAVCMGASIACMLSIILVQSYDMQTVIELGVGQIDNGDYERNTAVMLDWSMLTSYLLILIMLTIASFIMDGKFDQYEATLGLQRTVEVIMLLLPMFFVLASMVFSLLQPLDKNYAEKLKKYRLQMAEGKTNAPLENRLKKILVSNYPRQIAVTLLKPILRPFLPCRVYGSEQVNLANGPVVFVCNHLEVYGPIAAVLHSPFSFRPWVIQSMLDNEIIAESMQSGIDKIFHFLPSGARKQIGKFGAPILLWIMQSTDPVPVYRGTVRGVIQTIQLSVEAMEYDDNLLIFPEISYPDTGVGEFFSGFVQVGKSYYKQTGKCTTFYPMYIDKKRKRLTYAEGIQFNPENSNYDEKERIVNYLKETMNGMASLGKDD